MNPKSLPYISLLALLFGSTLVVSRFSVGQFAALTYVALRLLIAAGCHIGVFVASSERTLPRYRAVSPQAVVLGVIGTAIPMTAIVASLQYQSSGVTALLLTISPAITVLLAHFLLPEERLNALKVIGVALAIGGAGALVLQGESGLPDVGTANPLGYLLALGGVISASVGLIYARREMRDMDSVDVAGVRMWTATAVVLPVAFLLTGMDLSRVTASGYAAVIFAGLVGTFGAQLFEFAIVKRFGATAAVMTANLIPIVALIGGWLFLDEHITPGMIVAMVLIMSGVTIITRAETLPLAEPVES